MNIVIFGCRKITVDAINYILENTDHDIKCVVNHDEERDRVFDPMLVGDCCAKHGILSLRFENKVDASVIESYKPDVIFSLYYRKILPKAVLDIPPLGCINVHPAALPKYRGPAPSLWNILNGDDAAGVTIHYMVEGVGAGDIIDQRLIRIDHRTGFELNRDLMEMGYQIFVDNLEPIMNGTNARIPQKHEDATYCLPFKKSLRYVYWDDPDQIIRQLAVFTKPYDGALTYTAKGAKVVLWKGRVLSNRDSFKPPGCFAKAHDGIVVQTCTLPVLVTDYDVLEGDLKNSGRFVSGPPVV